MQPTVLIFQIQTVVTFRKKKTVMTDIIRANEKSAAPPFYDDDVAGYRFLKYKKYSIGLRNR